MEKLKTKPFTRYLLAFVSLLLLGTNALKAEETTLFDYTVSEGDKPNNVTATVGTVVLGADKVEDQTANMGVFAYKCDGDASETNTKYLKGTLASTAKFAVGDVITVKMACASNPSGSDFGISISADREGDQLVGTLYCTKKNTVETFSYTVKEGDAIVGKSEFYLFRATGKSTYIVSAKVTRTTTSGEEPEVPSVDTETVILSWNETPTLSSLTTDEMTNTGTSNNVATWNNGYVIMIMRSDKAQSNGENLTVDGKNYKTIKASNGAQNKLILPEGKVTKKITLYSYINTGSAPTNCYWKEVAGVSYTAAQTPLNAYIVEKKVQGSVDKYEFTFDATNEVTFTNAGTQPCYVVAVEVEDAQTEEPGGDDPEVELPSVVTFDFNASNHAVSSNTNHDGDITEDEVLTEGGVTMTITPNPKDDNQKTDNRYWGTDNGPQLRMYHGTITLDAGERTITKVVVNGTWKAGSTFNGETATKGEWTGEASVVVLDIPGGSGSSNINSITVYLASDDPLAEAKADLQATIAEIEKIALDDYTAESAQAVTNAIAAAKAALAAADASEESLAKAKADLIAARNGLVKKGVVLAGAGTEADPWNVAAALQASAWLKSEENVNDGADVYVTGIIKYMKEMSTQYGNATYSIVDNADDTDTLLVFRGNGLNGEKFVTGEEIAEGDIVVVCGKITNYLGTIEFATGSKLVSIKKAGTEEPTEPEEGNGAATVKMTYVDYDNADTAMGEVEIARAGYNKIANGEVGFVNTGWGENKIAYLQVDASEYPGTITKATLTFDASGSTDSKRTTGWGVGYNNSTWSADMTYNTADKSITTIGTEQWTTTKSATVFESFTFDITEALKKAEGKIATILVYETAAAGGYLKNPVVEVSYTTAKSYAVTFVETNNVEATVMVDGMDVTNGAELPNGAYEFTATAAGYKDYTGSFTVAGADKVVEFTMEAKAVYNYTVKGVDGEGNDLGEVAKGSGYEGESVTYHYPEFVLNETTLYKKNKNGGNPYWGATGVVDTDNKEFTVTYNNGTVANVVFYKEAEEMEGLTPKATNNADIRCSNGMGGITTDAVVLVTLPAGKYVVHGQVWGTAGLKASVIADKDSVWVVESTGSLVEDTAGKEFELTKSTELYVNTENGNDNHMLDYIYIVKTGDVEGDPLAELKSALETYIAMAEGYAENLDAYTDESAATLTQAIADAKAALADPNATEESLTEAIQGLMAAIMGLEEKPVEEGNWTTVGTAILEDSWVLPGLGIDQHADENKWEVELQRNEENVNLYRLVDPYHAEGPVKAHNESDEVGYITFDVTDPDHVVFLVTNAGFANTTTVKPKVNVFYAYNEVGKWVEYGYSVADVVETLGEDFPYTTFKNGVITINDACYGEQSDKVGGYDWGDADMTGSITLKINGAGDEPKDDEVVVTLVHTAAVQGGSNAALKTLDTETHYYNNWGTTAWAGQAYAGFAWTLPTNEVVVSATLKYYSNCGGNNNTRPMQVYYKDGTGFDYEGIELTAATGTLLAQVDDHLAVEEKTVNATDAVKDIISQGSSDIVFIFGGAAAGATLYGKGSADKAPQLIIETIDISETTSYTVNFVDAQNNVLKEAVVHTAQLKGAEVTASADEMADFKNEDASKKYIYESGNKTITLVEDATANVITLVFREAEVWNYTVNATVNDEPIEEIAAGTAFEGDTFTQPIPRLLSVNGTIYTAGLAGNVQASKNVVMSADNVVVNVAMTATSTTDVIFFAEAEDILTPATGGNVPARCSFMAGGYAEEAAEVVTLNAGVYKVTAASYANTSTNFTFTAGGNTVLTVTGTGGWAEVSSDEFTLTESTTLTVQGGTAINALDYIYITGTVTTGIDTVKSEFENGAVYNLQGQKVMKAQKGLYIINGKKVVVK